MSTINEKDTQLLKNLLTLATYVGLAPIGMQVKDGKVEGIMCLGPEPIMFAPHLDGDQAMAVANGFGLSIHLTPQGKQVRVDGPNISIERVLVLGQGQLALCIWESIVQAAAELAEFEMSGKKPDAPIPPAASSTLQ